MNLLLGFGGRAAKSDGSGLRHKFCNAHLLSSTSDMDGPPPRWTDDGEGHLRHNLTIIVLLLSHHAGSRSVEDKRDLVDAEPIRLLSSWLVVLVLFLLLFSDEVNERGASRGRGVRSRFDGGDTAARGGADARPA